MTEDGFILVFDVGSTKLKAGLVSIKDFRVYFKASDKSEIYYPKRGWAEQDPEKLWSQIISLSRKMMEESGVKKKDVLALIYTAHMAGVLPIAEDGTPLENIITWLDERAAGLPEELWKGLLRIEEYNLFKLIRFLRITGGAPSKTGKDPLSKIIWLREYEPDIYNSVYKFLDAKGYLIYKSTGNIVTSPDEANLTWLADTRNGKAVWSRPILNMFKLDEKSFPEIKDSIDIAGKLKKDVADELGVEADIPVFVGAGDIPTTAIGSGVVEEGKPHIYIGTSDWIAAHLSKRKTDIFHYIGSLLSAIPGKYLLIAEQEIAGGALEWAMNILGIKEGDYKSVEEAVESSEPGSNRILFLPWLYGERAPIDDPFLRGGLINFSLDHGKSDILRSIMEGVAFNIKWAYKYFQKMIPPQNIINIIGGGTLFDQWCQIVSDVLEIEIRRLKEPQYAGLRGGATIASVGLGIYKDFKEAVSRYAIDKVFTPDNNLSKIYNIHFQEFTNFYKKNKDIYKKLNTY